MGWTEENTAIAIAMARNGQSRQEIANTIGMTRNAVIGRLNRLGVGDNGPLARRIAAKRGGRHAAVAHRAKEQKARPIKVVKLANGEFVPARAPKAEQIAVAPHNQRGLIERLDEQCKWPIGDVGEPGFHFCDQTRILGKPYCPHHDKIAYRSFDIEPVRSFVPGKQLIEHKEPEPVE